MKKFVSPLQSLYEMKKNNEKQQKIELQRIENKIITRVEKLALLNKEFNTSKQEFCEMMLLGVSAFRIKQYDVFFERLKIVMSLVQKQIEEWEVKKEQCIQELINIRKEKKILDKLRAKKYKEYLKEFKKEQEKFIGDFIAYKVTAI